MQRIICSSLIFFVCSTFGLQSQPKKHKTDNVLMYKVYKKRCSYCHDKGISQAPKFGWESDWFVRLKYGERVLAYRSLMGKGLMPRKGGSLDLTDEEYIELALFLIRGNNE